MALKVIMMRHNLDRLNKELEALRQKDETFCTREAELEAAIGEVETDEQRTTIEAEVEAFDAEKTGHEEAKADLVRQIEELETELAEEERKAPAINKPKKAEEKKERNTSMQTINIRSLPMNQRAFDAIPAEQRNAILAQEDVKQFLSELRSMKGQTRNITGGALTIPVVFLDLIAENMYRYSKLMNRVRVRNVSGEARQTIAGLIPEAVWTEMCGNINELTFAFGQIVTDGYKVAGFIPVCNALLEDNDVNLASYIVEMISEAIGLAKDKAIIYGKGSASHMPLGIVTRLAQTSQPENYPANAPAWTDLHSSNILKINGDALTGSAFWSALTVACGNTFTKYSRGRQFWAMNSKTYNYLISKAITFTANGDIVANIYGALPVINGDIDILEFMPDYDIIGGYGDLYLWAQRAGMKIQASEHVQFIQDNTVYKGTERADGAPIIAGAFVAINIHNTDVTTTMTFAGDDANTVKGVLLPSSATVVSGETIALKAVLVPFGVEADVTYASSATSKATVSSTGVVTAVASGSANITATVGGYTATCAVTVTTE